MAFKLLHAPARIKDDGSVITSGALLIALIVVVAVAFNAWNAARQEKLQMASIESLQKIVDDWDMDDRIATQSPRIALANPVLQLRKRHEMLQNLAVSECLVPAKNTLLKSMDYSIKSFSYFMGQSELLSSKYYELAAKERRRFNGEFQRCKV